MPVTKEKLIYPTPNSTYHSGSTLSTSDTNNLTRARYNSKIIRKTSYDLYTRNPLPKSKNSINFERSTECSLSNTNIKCNDKNKRIREVNNITDSQSITTYNVEEIEKSSSYSIKKIAYNNTTNISNLNNDLYSPGDKITRKIKVKLLHTVIDININKEEDNILYIQLNTEKTWIIKKHQSDLTNLIKKTDKKRKYDQFTDLEYHFEHCDRKKLQCFIITDIVETFDFKSEYIYLHNYTRSLLNVKIANKNMFLYQNNKLYKIILLKDCDIFLLSDKANIKNGFVIYSNGVNNVLSCLTENERNEWLRFIRRIMYESL